ncbi:hypothetical protein C8J57DRAFT_1719811 [Mycena rebaudengoi]|nr:hypothetical protein C8J57DRAFT_1719811 [Mycena rebaudengoi]
MPSLPQELVDSIVALVDDPPAQRAIFKSLWLHPHQQGSLKVEAASESLAAFPHLAAYVHHLTMVIPHLEGEIYALESILLTVRNLERLVINGRSMRWSSVAPRLKSALQTIITLPSLHTLHLAAMFGLPSDLICSAASSVSTLAFYRTRLHQSEDPQHPPSLASDVQLTHIMLLDSGERVKDLCNLFLAVPARVTRLERLSIHIDPQSRTYADQFLTAISPSLRHLSLAIGGVPEPINLSPLPLVRTLDVQVLISGSRRFPTNFPTTFANLAEAFPSIEVLTLLLIFSPKPPKSPETWWLFEGTLSDLGPSFPNRTRFLHLRRVHCKLIPRHAEYDLSAAFRHFCTAMDECMPGLRGTGILTCSLGEALPSHLQIFHQHTESSSAQMYMQAE